MPGPEHEPDGIGTDVSDFLQRDVRLLRRGTLHVSHDDVRMIQQSAEGEYAIVPLMM